MSLLKFIAAVLLIADAYIGTRFLLNVFNILRTSKYSQTTTAVYAFLFLGLAIAGFYFLFIRHDQKTALWLSIGPWVSGLLILFITLITSDYK